MLTSPSSYNIALRTAKIKRILPFPHQLPQLLRIPRAVAIGMVVKINLRGLAFAKGGLDNRDERLKFRIAVIVVITGGSVVGGWLLRSARRGRWDGC